MRLTIFLLTFFLFGCNGLSDRTKSEGNNVGLSAPDTPSGPEYVFTGNCNNAPTCTQVKAAGRCNQLALLSEACAAKLDKEQDGSQDGIACDNECDIHYTISPFKP
ncbi:MAG: hypothetical protein NT086_08995 [Proteobacteria bacterium]|nr:hypothetical protein [Pseudomonadota bacterium]